MIVESVEPYVGELPVFDLEVSDNENFFVGDAEVLVHNCNGIRRRKLLEGNVGTVAVDEAHKVGSTTFSAVMNRFWSLYRFGVTATVKRKDNRHRITKMIIGPIVARTMVEAITPKVFIKDTGIRLRKDPKLWVFKMKALCNSKARNKMLVDRIIRDVKKGHHVVVPLIFTKHIHKIVQEVNDAYGSIIAEAFVGGGSKRQKEKRREILSRAKSGETKVIIGTRSLLQLGLNVPRWSCIYTAIPISNESNYKQETSRVRTPMEGKRQPIIRLFYDSAMPASIACARNCVTQMRKFKYEFSQDKITQASISYLYSAARGRRASYDDDDEFKPQRMLDFDEGTTAFGRAGRK